MIWSIIPEELIFAAEPKREAGQSVVFQGRRLYLRQGRIEGLLSTDPLDYLNIAGKRRLPGANASFLCFRVEKVGRDSRFAGKTHYYHLPFAA